MVAEIDSALKRSRFLHVAKVLVTGFEPFAGATNNPSKVVIESLDGEVETLLLPVVFGEASELLLKKIDQYMPDVVIALGQAEGRSQITPERIAINLDNAKVADNAGNIRLNHKIVENGADGYFTTLPIDEMVEAMNSAGVPAAISLSAGTFVCNHIFYSLQHHLQGKGIQSGFIHLPLLDSQAAEFPDKPTMSLELMLKGIRAALAVIS